MVLLRQLVIRMEAENRKPKTENTLRICFVSRRFFPAISGMSIYAHNLLRELVANDIDVTMISQYRNDALGKKVYGGGKPPPVAGVKTIGMESIGEQDGGNFEADVRRLVEKIIAEHTEKSFDLLHAQYGYPTGLAALEAGKILNLPIVVSIQGGDGHWVGVNCCATHRAAMQAVLNYSNEILIGSRSFAAEVKENHQVDVSRFQIVPGAVETTRFKPRDDWRAGKFIDESSPKILYHGRVDARKGVLDLIDAFAVLIAESSIKPQLIVSGIGPDFENVRAKITELNLGEHVQILGYADYESVPEIYRQADVFVSPTYAEGFSNTILEAMASGLTIVSTYSVGIVDCLRNRENGLLVQPGDVLSLKNALQEILTDDLLRKKLAENAFAECRAIYSWRTIGQQIIKVYESVRGQKPQTNWMLSTEIAACRYRDQPHLL